MTRRCATKVCLYTHNDLFNFHRPPIDIDSKATITINQNTFLVDADDLETICHLGKGAYGIVEKVRHRGSGTILAVKVGHWNNVRVQLLVRHLAVGCDFNVCHLGERAEAVKERAWKK